MSKGIGSRQRALLVQLELAGPVWRGGATQRDWRSIESLARFGCVTIEPVPAVDDLRAVFVKAAPKHRARRYSGKPPKNGVQVLEHECDGVKWTLYRMPAESADVWQNYKLVATKRVPHKANYKLGWNPAECRFALGRDFLVLREHLPELLEVIRLAMS